MSSYRSYIPARIACKRKIIERQFLNPNNDDSSLYSCNQNKVITNKQGYTDSTITNNMRVAQIISSNLGGRITFGNFGNPVPVSYLGGIEGQPGGLPRPIRNKF
jgi:hypothetical protein